MIFVESHRFGFNIAEWEQYFGIKVAPTGTTLEVKQCRYGQAIWIGEVLIWPSHGGHGRRKSEPNNRQWEAPDRVVKPSESCSIVPNGQGPLPSAQKEDDTKTSNTTSYTATTRNKTERRDAMPSSVGSLIVLSNLDANQYQKWTKQHQVRLNSFEI